MRGSRGIAAAAAVVTLLGCTVGASAPDPDPAAVPQQPRAEPADVEPDDSPDVVEIDGAQLQLPEDVGDPDIQPVPQDLRESDDGHETIIAAVDVDLDGAELTEPARLTVAAPDGYDPDTDLLFAVEWDPASDQWATSEEPVTVVDGQVTVDFEHFSARGVSWFCFRCALDGRLGEQVGQTLGEVGGTRQSGPSCHDRPLPSWVTDHTALTTVSAPLRVCLEPDDRDDLLTIRTVNNRAYTKLLVGSEPFAWTWQETANLGSYPSLAAEVARALVDDDSRMVIAPLAEGAIGFAQPADVLAVTLESQVSWHTLTADLIAMVAESVDISGADAVTQLWLTVARCIGTSALPTDDVRQLASEIIDRFVSCLDQLLDSGTLTSLAGSGVLSWEKMRTLQGLSRAFKQVQGARYVATLVDLGTEGGLYGALPAVTVNTSPASAGSDAGSDDPEDVDVASVEFVRAVMEGADSSVYAADAAVFAEARQILADDPAVYDGPYEVSLYEEFVDPDQYDPGCWVPGDVVAICYVEVSRPGLDHPDAGMLVEVYAASVELVAGDPIWIDPYVTGVQIIAG